MDFIDVEDQYKKFPQCDRSEVIKLMEWEHLQPHLPKINELEAFFFLHSCYYKIELAKTTIDIFYTSRTHTPEFFANRDISGSDMLAIKDMLGICPIQKLTPKGYKVAIFKIIDSDPNKFIFADCLKLVNLCFDVWMLEDGTAEGHIIAIDIGGFGFGHFARLGIMTLKKFLYYLQEGAPIRLKEIHFFNIVPLIDKILALMKPFLKKELYEAIHLHSCNETIYEFIPQDILPKDYDGPEESVSETHYKYFEHCRATGWQTYFYEEERMGRVNEKLRPGKPKNVTDIFGTEGNFKKLDFD